MTTRRAAGMIAALIVGGLCASDRKSSVAAAPAPTIAPLAAKPAISDRVIVRLVSRRHTVTVLAGLRYTVTDPSGRELVSRVTLDELRVRNPDAYQLVQPGATAFAGIGAME